MAIHQAVLRDSQNVLYVPSKKRHILILTKITINFVYLLKREEDCFLACRSGAQKNKDNHIHALCFVPFNNEKKKKERITMGPHRVTQHNRM